MPIEKITCVQFDGEFPDFCYRLIMPDYGMPLIGTMLAHAGYDVRIYLEHIQPAEPARIADSDLLCLSTLNAGADKTFRFARDVRQRLGIPIVIGGTQATYFPEACLEHSSWARVMKPSSSSSTRWPEGVTSRRWRASRTATATASGERARVPARRSSTSFRTST